MDRTQPERQPSPSSGLVLIVDDTEANRYAIRRNLEKAGYRVIEADTGEKGLQRARSEDPDVVILDIKLPDASGFDICARLKSEPHGLRIPVIHTSASFTRGEDHLRGVEGGADAFLITPVDPQILLSTVKAWLRVRKSEQERDRLDQKKQDAESALRQSMTLLNAISEASPDFIFAKDASSRMIFANPAVLKTLGKREAEVIGHTDLEFLGEKIGAPIVENDRRIMSNGRGELVEEKLEIEGRERIYLTHKVPYRGPDGKLIGLLGISRDVTELRQTRLELLRNVNSLEEERELRERFVASLSHDLRTPLTAARMSAQLLARKTGDPDSILKISARIVDNMDRVDRMIRDMLDASRIRAGEKIPLEIEECDLQQIASDTLDDLSTVHGDRFALQASDAIRGHWSCGDIRRVIENLCNNAVKYGAPHRPITVSLTQAGEQARLAVKNEGPPIPQQDQAYLFEPFRRVHSAQVGGQNGWGLGLTLVRGIAEAHGGKVTVESSAERGTVFQVSLPLDARGKAAF